MPRDTGNPAKTFNSRLGRLFQCLMTAKPTSPNRPFTQRIWPHVDTRRIRRDVLLSSVVDAIVMIAQILIEEFEQLSYSSTIRLA